MPYFDGTIDALIFDPPYMHNSGSAFEKIRTLYQSNNGNHAAVIRTYNEGILEASRVLRGGGIILVKCQDEIEDHKQKLSHVEVIDILKLCGFEIVDLFVLVSKGFPPVRVKEQKHARKNHSYAIVGKLKKGATR